MFVSESHRGSSSWDLRNSLTVEGHDVIFYRFLGDPTQVSIPPPPDLSRFFTSSPPLHDMFEREARLQQQQQQQQQQLQQKSQRAQRNRDQDNQSGSGDSGDGSGKTVDTGEDDDEFQIALHHIPETTSNVAVQRGTIHWGDLSKIIKSAQLTLKIWMPDRIPLEVHVEPSAMAPDVVAAALLTHKRKDTLRRNSGPQSPASPSPSSPQSPSSTLQWDRPELYCLMMHDSDGVPDDMVVPGDRPVAELNETELVLMPKSFAMPSSYSPSSTTQQRNDNNACNMDDLTDNFPDSSDDDGHGDIDEEDSDLEDFYGDDKPQRRIKNKETRMFSTISISDMARHTMDPENFGSSTDYRASGAISRRNTTSAHGELVSVSLPDGSECKMKLESWWSADHLIAELALRRGHHGLAVLAKEYELHVLWLDQERLRWPDTTVAPSENILRLQVTELELKPKSFLDRARLVPFGVGLAKKKKSGAMANHHLVRGGMSDSLAIDSVVGGAMDGGSEVGGTGGIFGYGEHAFSSYGGGGAGGSSMNAGSGKNKHTTMTTYKRAEDVYELMYVVQTAEHFEEWPIVKTNRWGRAQKRVIGIGRDVYDNSYKIWNKKRDDVNKSRLTDAVSRSARLLRDVCPTKSNPRGVRQLLAEQKPRFFSITFRDENEKAVEVQYEVPLFLSSSKYDSGSSGVGAAMGGASRLLKGSYRSGTDGAENESENDPVARMRAEKAACENCCRIVAKLLFLLDLQRRRDQVSIHRSNQGSDFGNGSNIAVGGPNGGGDFGASDLDGKGHLSGMGDSNGHRSKHSKSSSRIGVSGFVLRGMSGRQSSKNSSKKTLGFIPESGVTGT